MWPAFNSFVVLLPCGKKGADPPLERDARLQGWARRDEEREAEDVALCIPLFVCSTEEFFFCVQFSILEIIFLKAIYFSSVGIIFLTEILYIFLYF